jgi:cytochrome c-type protein NapC
MAYMKSNDSHECRACHNASARDLSAQERSAQKRHEQMQTKGKACIDCHKGVVHAVPRWVLMRRRECRVRGLPRHENRAA